MIDKILNSLKSRKKWAENGLSLYSQDDQSMREYEARIAEIDNAIYIVEQFQNADTKPFHQDRASTFQMPNHTGNINTGNPGDLKTRNPTNR